MSVFGRLCCKSRRHPPDRKTGNIRIRKAEFSNQTSLLRPDLKKMFFAPRPKIFLQQNLPLSEISMTVTIGPHAKASLFQRSEEQHRKSRTLAAIAAIDPQFASDLFDKRLNNSHPQSFAA
jgi:hypothetical protein